MFLSHYPPAVLRRGWVLDQYREKKREQVIKNVISRLQATPEPYKRLDLLSQLRRLLKPPSDNQHLTRLLSSSFQFFQCTQRTSQCWICMSLSPSPHIAIPLSSTWLSQNNYISLSQQKNHTTHWATLTVSFSQPLQT